ncbi:MAG: hypothetical protein M1814_004393 [Vezdaea aestivalis]|nr:MAG: hypothetical protein M1814_004393 [Vezdaea aestivalis]
MSSSADRNPDPQQPVCQNCQTSTTPLWRRDEIGSVLCNACGLFLKLHGKPRPISLKTDVIKSRNRVKSSGQGPKKKSLFDPNLSASRSDAGTPPPGHYNHRRTSGKTSSGASNRSDSPISRANTPSLQHGPHLHPTPVFDGSSLTDHGFHPSPSLPTLHLNHPSPGSVSSYTDRHLEPPQSYEALQSSCAALKTRVNELEVINDLFKGRVSQLEQSEHSSRHADSLRKNSEEYLRRELDEARRQIDDAHRREVDLKRRHNELEREVADLREAAGPRPKKMRLSDMVEDTRHEPPRSVSSQM